MATTKRTAKITSKEKSAIVKPVAKKSQPTQKRFFEAAIFNRLTSDWVGSSSINVDLQQGLSSLRSRSRDLSLNNEYARRYLKLIKTNVVGPEGVQISVQATNIDGSFDPISDTIEKHFEKWGLPENCTVTGKIDFRKVQELVLEAVARDGECLVWMRRGLEFGPYAFQLQVLDADHLDENYYNQTPNGNTIFQGVEVNQFGRAVAYHLWQHNPADTLLQTAQRGNTRIRVEAADLLHIYDTERSSQVRGYPWMTSAMNALHQIGKYREAELIQARIAATKQLYYKQQEDVGFTGDDDEIDDEGNITFEANPGSHEILPKGWSIETVNWNSPNGNFAEFQKIVLRGVAAGIGVSYNSLASDLESVNYSSARFGSLEDHAQYRSMQRWFINIFVKPVYEEWLKMQLLTNAWKLNIPPSRFTKFAEVRYHPRAWQSVDPVKDANADIALLEAGLTSHSDVIAKSGRDPEEVFKQIAKDKELMASLGLTPILKTANDVPQETQPPSAPQNGNSAAQV